MQRPLHARFLSDEDAFANKQPYVPSYPDVSPLAPGPSPQQQQYYPAYTPTPAYLPGPSGPSGSPDRHKRRPTEPAPRRPSESSTRSSGGGHARHSSILMNGGGGSGSGHVRTMSERKMPVYDAPITYGPPPAPAPPPKSQRKPTTKRRYSEPDRPLLQGTPPARRDRESKRDSLLDYGEGHIFISLSASSVLKLKNVPRGVPDELLLDALVARWRSGIASHRRSGADWQVTLHGNPWTAKGDLAFAARRIVVVLFQILGEAGYNYISAVPSSGLSAGSPTLIFGRTPTFYPSHFFSIAFSGSRRKIYIIDAPEVLLPVIANTIRRDVQDKDLRDGVLIGGGGGGGGRERGEGEWIANGIYAMEISTSGKIPQQDLPHRLGPLLHALQQSGYRLDASVSMGREGVFGMNGRKEVWVFRSNSTLTGVMYT